MPRNEARTYRHIEVVPVSGALGAEVRGVNVAAALDDAVIGEIRQALLDARPDYFKLDRYFDLDFDHWRDQMDALRDAVLRTADRAGDVRAVAVLVAPARGSRPFGARDVSASCSPLRRRA